MAGKDNCNGMTTKKMVLQIFTTVLGVPGTEEKGLVGEVKDLRTKHNKLNRNFLILVGILSGSGLLGANLIGVIGG